MVENEPVRVTTRNLELNAVSDLTRHSQIGWRKRAEILRPRRAISMTTSKYKNRFYFVRQIIMVAVIACLCVYAGEGLRLTPFPVFGFADFEAAKKQVRHRVSIQASNNYDPTIVPTRSMKRGKQQQQQPVVDHESPFSTRARKLAAQPVFLPVMGRSIKVVSLLLTWRIPSRAPPFVS
jgi:hypothetical protein